MEVDIIILSLILAILLILLLTVLIFLWFSGLFEEVDIKTGKPPFGHLEIAYKFGKSTFHTDSGVLFTEAHSIAPNLRCIGIWYDNHTESLKKRYMVGLILNDQNREANEGTKNLIKSKGYQFAVLPEVEHAVYASFPNKSMVSVVIALNRVVPKLQNYIKEMKLEAYPLIEISDGEKLLYAAPLSKQSEFYVTEALAESEEEPTSDQRTLSSEFGEELHTDTVSSVDSLAEGAHSKAEDAPSMEILDSLENNGNGMANGSEASTESFEELQLDS